ncbi:glycoside hydrolase family 2 TIM barrel-domain containing protein [Curtobacterium sp. RHCJP20]|uniref:Glycoside hydrolase family 2 TIM barrel-domain containing protein n=1 Tax=Curtobacterium subtropicum TaxID=3055138 RepID=A0ABT7TDE9_9MICO|nr:sugar-binding domain-containing protein [Curtobacterium subtropicum]MDM7887601.1 glycoside hydrolase family 2 TIM barrel-domain containing protein [Curtobacterium subtropicum]
MSSVAPSGPLDPDTVPLASRQDGRYPRPQLVRRDWVDLCGPWDFRHDDGDTGREEGWATGLPSPRTITVPFPPESEASGIAEPGFHPVVWYARTLGRDELAAAGHGPRRPRLLLHFGAVDHSAQVWIDGRFVGQHEGGHTPFTLDVTALLTDGSDADEHLLVVRAEDDPHDVTLPRGKQDWHEDAHAIWYRRTTGIWQTVWLEAVPTGAIDAVRWTPAGPTASALSVRFRGPVPDGARLRIALRFDERDEDLGSTEWDATHSHPTLDVTVPVARQRNGQAEDELTWSPETPRLVDAVLTLVDTDGRVLDVVGSYLGIRSVGVGGGRFLLNRQPYTMRSVLDQAFWPQSHLAAPHPLAHRQEVELVKALGFNAVRLHQKIEDPRFLYWADRLGVLVWGEAPNAYEFSPTAVQRLTTEWIAAVERDVSHPSIVTWVPLNESWGIQHVVTDPAQQAYARALVDLTRALDPSRPVVSNDGWEQQDTDIVTIHDYEGDGAVLARTYADETARTRALEGLAPSGHPQFVGGAVDRGQPVMLTEFGGVRFRPAGHGQDGWGYTSATDGPDWIARVAALHDAVRASSFLAGSCWTQLTDTMQETNGLLAADRSPKVPIEQIRRAVTGG